MGRIESAAFGMNTMTHSRFFQLSLCWPFAAWFLYVLFSSVRDSRGLASVVANLYESYPIFIPYALFAALLWKLSRGREFRQLVMIAAVAPVVWGAFYTSSHLAQFLLKERIFEGWFVLAVMFFWATVVGYVVESIPLIILVIFKDDFRPGHR